MPKLIDLTGQRFGKLTVLKLDGKGRFGHMIWLCQCDCSNIKPVLADRLRRGTVKSCGCMARNPAHRV